MGGQAFAVKGATSNPTFTVPRMNEQIYHQVKHAALSALSDRERHGNVVALAEAPGKPDYGDVDLVLEPRTPTSFSSKILAQDLGAKHVIENHPGYHFAVPETDLGNNVFAQVDVLVCAPGDLTWTLFFRGHGDLGQILGVMYYGSGFTANNTGFHVRIREQEMQDWKASRVLLSNDASKVMEFLHLDSQQYAEGFQTEQQLFTWLSRCRLLDCRSIKNRMDDSEIRQRTKTRPMFRRFITEYLSSLPTNSVAPSQTREELLQEALSFFGKEVEFDTRRNMVLAQNANNHAWEIIKTTVLQPLANLENKRLNEVVRALKRCVAFEAGEPYLRDEANMETESQPGFSVMIDEADQVKPVMRDWILEHWMEARGLERERAKNRKRLAE